MTRIQSNGQVETYMYAQIFFESYFYKALIIFMIYLVAFLMFIAPLYIFTGSTIWNIELIITGIVTWKQQAKETSITCIHLFHISYVPIE